MASGTGIMAWQRLGRMPYREARAFQESLRAQRERGSIADRLLFVEHPPVITLGRRACADDLRSSREALAAAGIEVVQSDRGGRATYHGLGQIVGYAVMHLRELGMGVAEFVRAIEEICIGALADAGVRCGRDERHPGLWVGRDKIVAIGLRVSGGITQHGFALNLDCDLAPYRHLLACGIADRGITSVARLVPSPLSIEAMQQRIVFHAGRVFGRSTVEIAERAT